MKKVKVVRDHDSHWYVIPEEYHEEFYNLLNLDDEYSEFMNKFDKYRTGGDVNIVQLYAEID